MFGFLRKEKAPAVCPGNPGITTGGRTEFRRGDRAWAEEFDVLDIAESVLSARGESIIRKATWLVHPKSGFTLQPRFVELRPVESGGVKTTTTVQVNHPTLFPGGLFEYQHSTGDNTEDSIRKGIEQWAEMDLVPLLESLQPSPATCMILKMPISATDSHPAKMRRAVLGPAMHWSEHPLPAEAPEADAHNFCPCCLLTNSFETFRELFEDRGFCGLRLYAARDSEGNALADCRVNGRDWEKGAEALREYAKTWPTAGFEIRKQYVVLHCIEKE